MDGVVPSPRTKFSGFSRSVVFFDDLGRSIMRAADPRRRKVMAAVACGLLLVIGGVDFVVNFEFSLLIFYCLPLIMAVTAFGWRFGVITAMVAVVMWLVGDMAAGVHYNHPWALIWNALMVICTYWVVIWLFSSVLRLQAEMEARIQQRTAALTAEIASRERLEKMVMEITERERQVIGHDLHDGLGQHLTGTAFAAQVLGEKLQDRGLPEQNDARQLVRLIDESIDQTRRLAKGLLLSEIQNDELVESLQEFALETSKRFRLACVVTVAGEVRLADSEVATHLLRIAQEAVRNAIRHAKASRIEINVTVTSDHLQLSVEDDGVGLKTEWQRLKGLGLRIMAHRAQLMGAQFSVAPRQKGGTAVTCILSLASTPLL